MNRLLRDGLVGPSLTDGVIVEIRRQFGLFLRANQKYPDFCEIGPGVFTELYDWHVRHRQPIEITRTDNRLTIRFMFTGMVLRPEQDPRYVGHSVRPRRDADRAGATAASATQEGGEALDALGDLRRVVHQRTERDAHAVGDATGRSRGRARPARRWP